MSPDPFELYSLILKSRLFEIAVKRLWGAGLISGEMHTGLGEEAIIAGIVSQLQDGDALALDHRGTSSLLICGVDPVLLLREFLGKPDGLCRGMGGHMHLFSKSHLAASSGIVGASGPAAVGFALAASYLRPDRISVSFFGDGAVNSGMLMESMNLASAWNLPVLFVCKDNQWAITTKSNSVTGGKLLDRAHGFGLYALEVDGLDVLAVWQVAHEAIERPRTGKGPAFILAHCVHLEGHFLGDPLLDMARKPGDALRSVTPIVQSIFRLKGASAKERINALGSILGVIAEAQGQTRQVNDPLLRARQALSRDDAKRLGTLEESLLDEVQRIVEEAVR